MTNNLGTILAGIREKEKISQKSIADGIISSNFMCKLEKGEKELVDYKVDDLIFRPRKRREKVKMDDELKKLEAMEKKERKSKL